MKLSLFVLVLLLSCSGQIKPQLKETSNIMVKKSFDVDDFAGARRLMENRLTYLREFYRPTQRTMFCVNRIRIGNLETDSSGNLFSYSDLYLDEAGLEVCSPESTRGWILTYSCSESKTVHEIRYSSPREGNQVKFPCP